MGTQQAQLRSSNEQSTHCGAEDGLRPVIEKIQYTFYKRITIARTIESFLRPASIDPMIKKSYGIIVSY